MRHRILFLFLGMILGDLVVSQTTWRRTFGGLDADQFHDVRYLDDGGYAAFGSTGSFGNGGGDMYFVRLDEGGEMLWSRTYGDQAVQVGVGCIALDDGFALAGTTANGGVGGYDIRLLRTNVAGGLMWVKDHGTTDWDLCTDVEALPDGFVLSGTTYGRGAGGGDAFLIRTDLGGDTVWCRTFGGLDEDAGLGVDVTSSGEILLSGSIRNGDNDDGFVVAYAADGSPLWSMIAGGDSTELISSVTELPGGGYVCAGTTHSYNDVFQAWVVGIDADGDQAWEQHYGSVGDTGMDRIELRTDGGLALIGYNSAFNAGGKDMFLLLTDANGNFQLGKNYGGPSDEIGYAVRCTDDGGFVMVGSTNSYGPGVLAAYAIKAGPDGETLDDTVYETLDPTDVGELEPSSLQFHPNPSNGRFNIPPQPFSGRWSLVDASGRIWVDRPYAMGTTGLEADVPTGLYLLRLMGNDGAAAAARVTIVRP